MRLWWELYRGLLSGEELEKHGIGRMIGTPAQYFLKTTSPQELEDRVKQHVENKQNVYVSISYFTGHNQLFGLEKILFDIDAHDGDEETVRKEVKKLIDHLQSYGKPMIMFTGGGYHIILWYPHVIEVHDPALADYTLYTTWVKLGIEKLGLRKLDKNTLRHGVLTRFPGTKNMKWYRTVRIVDTDLRTIELDGLGEYMNNPLAQDVFEEILERARQQKRILEIRRLKQTFSKDPVKTPGPRKYEYIKKILSRGLEDGRKRFILYAGAPYLVTILKIEPEEAVDILYDFTRLSEKLPGFRGDGKIYRSMIRAMVRNASSKKLLPARKEKLLEYIPEIKGILEE